MKHKAPIHVIIVLLLVSFFTSSCNNNQSKEKYQASIRFGWIPSASFSGEIAGMNKFAATHNLSLKCEAGGPGLNSIQLVQTGQNTFGTLAADEVLAANDKGADFVIVGVINYYSPGGFVSLPDRDIQTPKDFEGKKVGILPFGSTTLLYESMVKRITLTNERLPRLLYHRT